MEVIGQLCLYYVSVMHGFVFLISRESKCIQLTLEGFMSFFFERMMDLYIVIVEIWWKYF